MTLLDWVQVGFLIMVVIVGVGGIIYIVKNEDKQE